MTYNNFVNAASFEMRVPPDKVFALLHETDKQDYEAGLLSIDGLKAAIGHWLKSGQLVCMPAKKRQVGRAHLEAIKSSLGV